jgi:hypothetical protein
MWEPIAIMILTPVIFIVCCLLSEKDTNETL